jgi:hypothetical protein
MKQISSPTFGDTNSDNKENSVVGTCYGTPLRRTNTGLKQSPQYDDQANFRKDIPRTPAGRLAVPDLIGLMDSRRVEMEGSPGERLMWDLTKVAIHGSASLHSTSRRVKKRARSSSPTSSPARTPICVSNEGRVFDLNRPSQTLKTSQVDPGYELWDRYTLKTDKSTPKERQNPSLAHIMNTSSPQSSRAGFSVKGKGSKRRWIGRSNSCGTEWPTKRRRVTDSEGHFGNNISSETLSTGPSRISLVNALLEKVPEAYNSTSCPNEPLGSSPSPRRKELGEEQSSRLQKLSGISKSQAEQNPPLSSCPDISEPMIQEPILLGSESSPSDYGDFDDEALDYSIMEPTETIPVFSAALEIKQNNLFSEPGDHGSEKFDEVTEHTHMHSLKNEENEFDDLDEDFSAADLEDLEAKYDTRPLDAVAPEVVEVGAEDQGNHVGVQQEYVNSDDEYGNDFDDLDYEEAEAPFTQYFQQSNCSLPSVRSTLS